MPDLSNTLAVITGASDGFGFSMSRALLQHGATVVMTSKSGPKLQAAVATLQTAGLTRCVELPMDVRDAEATLQAADWVEKELGAANLLVNNAGIGNNRLFSDASADVDSPQPRPFYELDPEAFRDVVETNFIGCFLAARAFVPQMIRRGGGRLVHISTSIPTMTAPGQIPYGPAKAAAEAFTRILSQELAADQILVNVLLPGGPAYTGLLPARQREEYQRTGAIPSNLLPADILDEPLLFLASEAAAGLTGERIIARDFQQWLADHRPSD
ncbi:MAG: SDR family oxidoreductase [Actinomycetia bacterium]|nr:SDR family oxidoreductase [Actinomycetes bacterium]